MLPYFLNFFCGFFIQILPLTFLVVYPLSFTGKISPRRIMVSFLSVMVAESAVFGFACLFVMHAVPASFFRLNLVDVVFLLCLIPQGILYFRVLTCPVMEKIFLLLFGLICGNFSASLSNLLYERLFPDHAATYMPYCAESDILLLFFGSITTCLAILFLKRFYMPVREMASRREFGYFSVLSIALFLIIGSGLSFMDFGYFDNPMTLFLFFVLYLSVLLVYLSCFLMFRTALEKFLAENQLQQIRHNLELGREQYSHISDMMEQNRKIRHDFRHHAVVLKGLLEEKKYDRANSYIDRYTESMDTQDHKQYCRHPVINILSNYYALKCQERGIRFSVQIGKQMVLMNPDRFGIEDGDLCVILGNLLENALEAASEPAEAGRAFIRLNLLIHGAALVIAMDNSFYEGRRMAGGRYESTKKDHTGIGLSSIQSVAEKYDGGVEFDHENGIFHSSVMLPLSET